jgi:hypothetical protein
MDKIGAITTTNNKNFKIITSYHMMIKYKIFS